MYKITRIIERNFSARKDAVVDSLRRTVFRMIFALAIATKVTPKMFAKALEGNKTKEYAEKFLKETRTRISTKVKVK